MDKKDNSLSVIHISRSAGGVHAGDVTYRPGGQCGPRWQMRHQLFWMLEGSCRLQWEERRLLLGPGQMVLLAPGRREIFRFDDTTPSRHRWFDFDPAVHPLEPLPAKVLAQVRETPAMIDSIFAAACETNALPGPVVGQVLSHLGQAAWAAACSSGLPVQSPAVEGSDPLVFWPDPLLRAHTYLEQHHGEPLTLSILAKVAGVTPQHLVRLFRQYTGQTPMRALRDFRLRQGRRLLLYTGLRVNEIAAQTGFVSAFHFSREIRRQYSGSPRELREAAWARDEPGLKKRK